MVAQIKSDLVTGGDPDERYKQAPVQSMFGLGQEQADFIPADDLRKIGEALMDRHADTLGHLGNWSVVYLWKRAGGATKGKSTLGKCQKPSGLLKYFADATFVVWLAADHCRLFQLTRFQVEALVYHELLHAGQTEEGAPTIWPHDFEGFRAEVDRYGFWEEDLRKAAESFQLRLLESEADDDD